MSHQLTVPDELWDLYEASGMNMREALWEQKVERALREAKGTSPGEQADPFPVPPSGGVRSAASAQPSVRPEAYGTLFFASKVTPCPLCSAAIHPTMLVVQTSWTRRISGGVVRGGSGAVHLDCAKRAGIEVRWSKERVLGDLREIIARIPRRKLRVPAGR